MNDKQDLLKQVILMPNGNVQAIDYTGTLNLIPRNWGLVEALGLFGERFGTQKTFFVGRREEKHSPLLEDRNWEGTRPTLTREGEEGITFKIPHFPVDDMILPNDIDGQFQMGEFAAGSELANVASVRARKLDAIRRAHTATHEFARIHSLVTGNVYAPTGTLKTSYGSTVNVYNEWGITRQTHALRTGAGVNPQESVDELVGKLQDASFTGDPIDGWIVICSPKMFAAVTRNDYVREIYAVAQLAGRQELLVGRLGNKFGLDKRYRSFEYADVTFIEYRGGMGGQLYIPDGEGIALPLMSGIGRLHFAPPNKFGAGGVNTTSQASYVWERMDDRMTKIELESETNFAAILDRPDLVFGVTLDETPAVP